MFKEFGRATAILDVEGACGKHGKEKAGTSSSVCVTSVLEPPMQPAVTIFYQQKARCFADLFTYIGEESCFGFCWFKVLPFDLVIAMTGRNKR